MQSPNARYGPQPAALKWAIAAGIAAVIVLALLLSVGSPLNPNTQARAIAQPTACPDTIACHVLKRMPQQNAVSTSIP